MDTDVTRQDQHLVICKSNAVQREPLVFFHIPRTRGTSVWHQLAQFSDKALCCYDLNFETEQQYGLAIYARATLTRDLPKLRTPLDHPLCIHHHVPVRLDDLLPGTRYFAFFRDPVARFVSDLVWHCRLARTDHPPVTLQRDLELWASASVEKARGAPALAYLKNYYWNMIWGLMGRLDWTISGNTGRTPTCCDVDYLPTFSATQKVEMIEFIAQHFVLCGVETAGDTQASFLAGIAARLNLPTGSLDADYKSPLTIGDAALRTEILPNLATIGPLQKDLTGDYEFCERVAALNLGRS